MELIVIAIVIFALLAFYPIRVRPRPDLVSPTAIMMRVKPQLDSNSFFFDPHNMPGTYPNSTDRLSPKASRCSLCNDENCDLCGSSDCGDDFYICSWCNDKGLDGVDDCPYCTPLYTEPGEITRLRLNDGNDLTFNCSDHFNSDVFISDDFDAAFYHRNDYLAPTSSFSDPAVGHGEPQTEVFYYEGRRYIAATYNNILVIRPDF